jgi:hypothetical protein
VVGNGHHTRRACLIDGNFAEVEDVSADFEPSGRMGLRIWRRREIGRDGNITRHNSGHGGKQRGQHPSNGTS